MFFFQFVRLCFWNSLSVLPLYLGCCVIFSCAVMAAKTGRGAEAAGGAGPGGGADSTAGRGGATKNQS